MSENITRADGRAVDQLREITIERGWSEQAEGSALISFGKTKVLCTASFTSGVPRWMTGKGKGWVTAEYAMIPRSTNSRMDREAVKGKIALAEAIEWGKAQSLIPKSAEPLIDSVAAVSVGIIDGTPMLDLAYVEDVRAETDMNVVVTGRGLFVEVQGTAEGAPFDRDELNSLLDLAIAGSADLTNFQRQALA